KESIHGLDSIENPPLNISWFIDCIMFRTDDETTDHSIGDSNLDMDSLKRIPIERLLYSFLVICVEYLISFLNAASSSCVMYSSSKKAFKYILQLTLSNMIS